MNNADAATNHAEPPPNRLVPIFAHATATALGALPDPVPNTPQAREARDINTLAQVAALVPVNAVETMVAVQFVTTSAHGIECQRQAETANPALTMPLMNLSVRLLRTAHSAANVLIRLQTMRMQREASPEAASSAAMTEHCAMELMMQARTARETARENAREQADREAAAQTAEEAARAAEPPPGPEPLTTDHIVAAEQYATSNPTNENRARIIRYRRRMPDWGMFAAPSPEVINALIHGHSPILDALLPGPEGD